MDTVVLGEAAMALLGATAVLILMSMLHRQFRVDDEQETEPHR